MGDNTLEALGINDLPDFSRVGYREGHVAIPKVPVRVTLLPSSNGADDTTRIQKAIDKVSEMNLSPIGNNGAEVRGAVLLKAGVYRVAGALVLHSSGVVLRGEGQGAGGTTVKATGDIQRDFILINGMLNSKMGSIQFQKGHPRDDGTPAPVMMPKNAYETSSGLVTHTRAGVGIPFGETNIPVESTKNFFPGDHIVVSILRS